jgi:transcription antitermination factor NusG
MSQALRKAELYASLSPPAWYAFCALREYRARDDLRLRLGVDQVWLPECRVVVSSRRQRRVIDGPLFPGYGFVRGVLTDEWLKAVLNADGVDDVLRMHGRPVAARPCQIAKLQRLVSECGGRVLIECGRVKRGFEMPMDEPMYQPGQDVRVLSGPFAGFNALVKEQAGTERLNLMLDIFGRLTETEIDEASVEAVA